MRHVDKYDYHKRKHERGYDILELYYHELLDDPTITLEKFSQKNQYSYSKITKLSSKNDWIPRGQNYLEHVRNKRLKKQEGIFLDLNWSQLQLAIKSTHLEIDLIDDQQERFNNKTLQSSTISNTLKKTEESAQITMNRYYTITGHKMTPDEEPNDEASEYIETILNNEEAHNKITMARMQGSTEIQHPAENIKDGDKDCK
ncbi:hypothetical protein [Methanosphaera sp.]|uniref:hypothetical protein n=1 Tax=Methanosphaera sp. TaxID=2666342 RepID=UPI0025DEDB49|nr:hypothetical protein [Methanosphaera sp.]